MENTTLRDYSNGTLTEEQLNEYRKDLRNALTPAEVQYNKTFWSDYINNRLSTLAIYSTCDKSGLKPTVYACLKLYSWGLDYHTISSRLGIKSTSVEVYVSQAIKYVVKNTKPKYISMAPRIPLQYIVSGCPRCHDDLIWRKDKDRYNCLRCDNWYDINMEIIKN